MFGYLVQSSFSWTVARIQSIGASLLSRMILDFTRWVLQTWMILMLAIRDLSKYWCAEIPFLPRKLHHNQFMCFNIDNYFSEKKYQLFCCHSHSLYTGKTKVVWSVSPIQIGLKHGDTMHLIIEGMRENFRNIIYWLTSHWCEHPDMCSLTIYIQQCLAKKSKCTVS